MFLIDYQSVPLKINVSKTVVSANWMKTLIIIYQVKKLRQSSFTCFLIILIESKWAKRCSVAIKLLSFIRRQFKPQILLVKKQLMLEEAASAYETGTGGGMKNYIQYVVKTCWKNTISEVWLFVMYIVKQIHWSLVPSLKMAIIVFYRRV